MKIVVPEGAVVKYKSSKKKLSPHDDSDFEIDTSGFVTTKFLKKHGMKVDLAHEEDCGCGSPHPFGAVSVYDNDCSNRVLVSTNNSVELYLKGSLSDGNIVIHPLNDGDRNKEWFARMQYSTIYEMFFKNDPWWKRLKFVFVFTGQLIWRYLFKRK